MSARVAGSLAALTLILGALAPSPVAARDLFEEGELRLELRSAFKGSLLLFFPPDDPVLHPPSPAGGGFFRLRFDMTANLTEYFTAAVAYENRVRMSSGSGAMSATLPVVAPAPFRLTQGDWVIIDEAPGYLHQHEIDRAYVALHLPFMELTVGRQAIGLGRGAVFSAVDIFAPFTPTEVDREWRRGIDAVHVELRIPEISELSADVIVALGAFEADQLQTFAAIGRLRAVVEEVDASVLLGRRGEDNMVGLTLSATVGDAEVHGELSLFGTDGRGIDGGLFGTDGVVAKGLLGGSYMIDIGTGLRVVLEYHYSGFGVENVGASPDILFDPAFQARFLRGDSQILGRHALALALSYSLFDDLAASLTYLQSPVDGSGVLAPSLVWSQSDSATIVLAVNAPWGTWPVAGVPTSEYGASPITIFLQARLYD